MPASWGWSETREHLLDRRAGRTMAESLAASLQTQHSGSRYVLENRANYEPSVLVIGTFQTIGTKHLQSWHEKKRRQSLNRTWMLHHVDFRVNRASYSHTDCIVSIHDYTRTIIGAPSYRNRASTVTETSLGPDQTPQSTWPCRGSLLPRILEPVTSFLPLTTLCPEQLAARSPSSRGRQSEPCAAQSTGGTDGAQGRHLERNRGASPSE